MTYGYMPACCSYYTSEDLARMDSERNADKIKALEKEVETLKQKLEQMPTIESKNGEWENVIGEGRLGKQVRCGYCGEQFWAWMSKFHYCPNCGAKMERSEE